MLRVLMHAVTVQGWADAEKKLEGVAKIVAVVPIESVGAVVDGELGAEADVDAVAVRQVAHVTQRVTGHRKDTRVRCLIKDQLVSGLFYVFPSKIDRVAAALII